MPTSDAETMTRMIYVTGKGGVGKTTISKALCAAAHRAGEKVALATFAATPDDERRWQTIEIDPRRALIALVERLLRMRFISRRVLGSRTFNAVSAAAPGVRDLAYMAYLADLADGCSDAGRFDRIVVDGFATGHSLALLGSPNSVHDLVRMGPIAAGTARAEALLADAARFRALIVAVPEELPVFEAVDLWKTLGAQGIARMDPIANRVFPQRLTPSQRDWVLEHDASSDCRLYEAMRAAQAAAGQRLASETGRQPTTLDFHFDDGGIDPAAAARILEAWK
jgi:anion-transporting  ArsA/GET3 family ATPase